MKASLNLDQFADLSTMSPELRTKIAWKPVDGPNGRKIPVAIFPAGTVFEGPQALALCQTGQATPADEECSAALGKTPEEAKALAVEYEMNSLGIFTESGRDLFRAGVISGYNADGTEKPGPNWEAYHAAVSAESTKDQI